MVDAISGNDLSASKPQMLLERQQAMMQALKAGEFEKALQHARAALALDPSHVLVIQFVRLLEVKLSLENDDSEDTNEDSGSAEDPEDQEGGSDNEDDDSSSEGDEDDDEEEEESSSDDDDGLSVILKGNGSSVAGEHKLLGTLQFTAQGPSNSAAQANAAAVEGLRSGVESISLQATGGTRKELREKLASGVRRLKHQQTAQAMMASDSLLGA